MIVEYDFDDRGTENMDNWLFLRLLTLAQKKSGDKKEETFKTGTMEVSLTVDGVTLDIRDVVSFLYKDFQRETKVAAEALVSAKAGDLMDLVSNLTEVIESKAGDLLQDM